MILQQAERDDEQEQKPSASIPSERLSGVALHDEEELDERAEPSVVPTWVEVHYPRDRGAIGLRGSRAPLSWEHSMTPTRTVGDDHLFCFPLRRDEPIEVKVVRGEDWIRGRNHVVHGGDRLRLEPSFDGRTPVVERGLVVEHDGRAVKIDVLLPPSYGEQPRKRYPVLYALDGQALWSDSSDPFGNWALDSTLGSLYDLAVIDELIVVGIETRQDRLAILSPVPDRSFGGGAGHAFLEHVVDRVRPFVDARYRTRSDPASTGILGSSMGGLFAFFAAWTRPEVFGKAICLSSSFWWADRWAVRHAQSSEPPFPRPSYYLDTGATPHPMEEDARVIDGFDHTRSMHRALTSAGFVPGGRCAVVGGEVHRLAFPGHRHEAAAWASRVALPLQLFFPSVALTVDADRWQG